jgi:hypothetical protein
MMGSAPDTFKIRLSRSRTLAWDLVMQISYNNQMSTQNQAASPPTRTACEVGTQTRLLSRSSESLSSGCKRKGEAALNQVQCTVKFTSLFYREKEREQKKSSIQKKVLSPLDLQYPYAHNSWSNHIAEWNYTRSKNWSSLLILVVIGHLEIAEHETHCAQNQYCIIVHSLKGFAEGSFIESAKGTGIVGDSSRLYTQDRWKEAIATPCLCFGEIPFSHPKAAL